jgi:Domain of unknown function (DUF4384)
MHSLWKSLIISICAALAFSSFAYVTSAAEQRWVEAVGEATADDTRTLNDVKQEALERARRQAIEQVVGLKVQGETMVRNFAMQSDFVASLSSGTILEERVLRWETQTIKKDETSAPLLIYRVFLKAKVALETASPDPAFKISATLNRPLFKNGDDVVLQIKPTRDCYITILVVTENNNVYLVLPNKHKKSNFIKEGEEYIYPSDDEVSKGLTLKAGLLPGCKRAKENFRIIATKKPINFTPDIFAEGIGLESFTKETAAVSELVKELVTIPANERTEAFLAYEIVN